MVPSFTDIRKFTVARSTWSRGRGKNTSILDEMGDKDCLGFFLKAGGASDAQLLRADEPIDVVVKYGWNIPLIEYAGWTCYQTKACREIIATNDAPLMNDAFREFTLIGLFKTINVALDFVD